ncbi:hypothetical protein HAX54_026771 [Datura stramonium]|uniref:Uncharacterized protein n=1 Tax=Datura stramonium TaxID=4076 RepID=A0ABS8V1N3_DATST|nr:hypothetical protein [Datura stramonium]
MDELLQLKKDEEEDETNTFVRSSIIAGINCDVARGSPRSATETLFIFEDAIANIQAVSASRGKTPFSNLEDSFSRMLDTILEVDTLHEVQGGNLNLDQAIVEAEAAAKASKRTLDQVLSGNEWRSLESRDFMITQ